MKIIITERIAQEGIDYLINEGYDVDLKFGISHDDLLEIIDQYDAIIVRSVTKVNKEVIEKGVNLKVAGRAGNGIDNIDVEECTKHGIIAVNTPESNVMAAAELAVGMAFCVFRNIVQADKAGRKGDFRRNLFVGKELDEKVAGIIGFGRIGKIVASKLVGCNMKVICYDPYVTEETFEQYNVKKCDSLEELIKASDLISLHTPKTVETKGLIGEKELAMCKKGVRIVNAARGGLVDEKALYNALKSGQVSAAALDVLDPEPGYDKTPEDQDYTNPLLELDNIIITPHLGASTMEATYNVGTAVTKLVDGALQGELVPAVNLPTIKKKDVKAVKPFVELAEMMGKIYYQTEKEQIKSIEIKYRGELAEKETKLISLSVAKGFLSTIVKENVNYVNTELILESMGIDLVESKSSHIEKYTNMVTVSFVTISDKKFNISGTVFAKDQIRLIDFYGYHLDFDPTKYIVAIQNEDVPGIIGKIGTAFGNFGVNIGAMQWSRNQTKDRAISFVSVDIDVSEDLVEEIRGLEGVLKVSKINL